LPTTASAGIKNYIAGALPLAIVSPLLAAGERGGNAMFSEFFKVVFVPLLLRLVLAAVFIFHGWDKIGAEAGTNWHHGPDAPPSILQLVVAWGELIGGIAMAVGFLTRLAGLGLIAIMAAAIATTTWPQGFSNVAHGYEYNMVIIVVCVCLVLGGPGPLSLDRIFRVRRRG
jgi:putative oxidoreductase